MKLDDFERNDWYKDAVLYELHVRAFNDSNGDGIGDIQGIREKLDYIASLGVTAIWLLPFYPSPLKDDGYDIADYRSINEIYGNLKDFKELLKDAHERKIKVITELVINHTSNQHPWFERARKAPKGHPHRDFYVWTDNPDKYKEVRIIFKDFETSNWTYDSVAKAYYWHRFYSHQPDLNFDNPKVQKEIMKLMDYWFEMGVDGVRLDAIPYLFEREGTSCENLPETHEFIKKLRKHVDRKFPGRMFLAEANQWPEDAVEYFGDGDECHMAYHFPLMPRMFMAIRMEDSYPIRDILSQTPEIPESAQWAIFLRNHDELTLEMVTDEERDYMYRVYASDPRARINLGIRRRLAPLLGNDRRKIELMNALLFSFPGTPVIYYGDEIGMGDNIYLGDRDSVRTPLQWSPDRNAGFSRGNPQKLFLPVIIDPEYHFEAVNIEAQQSNPNSLLWWMRRIIDLRKQYEAFSRGSLEFVDCENRKILSFIRKYEDETILVVANLSGHVECAELSLPDYRGYRPVELSGHREFPQIDDYHYFLSVGPYGFYWFELETTEAVESYDSEDMPELSVGQAVSLTEVLKAHQPKIEKILPKYMADRRWFAGKGSKIKKVRLRITAMLADKNMALCVVEVDYADGESEMYQMAIGLTSGSEGARIKNESPDSIIASLDGTELDEGMLYEALNVASNGAVILELFKKRKKIKSDHGTVFFDGSKTLTSPKSDLKDLPEPDTSFRLQKAEQSNTSIIIDDSIILKYFRRLQEGINPDIELGEKLWKTKPDWLAEPLGSLHYTNDKYHALAFMQRYVDNQGPAFSQSVDAVRSYIQVAKATDDITSLEEPESIFNSIETADETFVDPIGTYLITAEQIADVTARMHASLASFSEEAMVPEAVTPFYQRGLFQSMRNQTESTIGALSKVVSKMDDDVAVDAKKLIKSKKEILDTFHKSLMKEVSGHRIRIHGDYHLGQLLYTGKSFVVIDFEGEPLKPTGERRLKRSPLRDVAGMLRSFHYAAMMPAGDSSADFETVERLGTIWYRIVASVFLKRYRSEKKLQGIIPNEKAFETTLTAYLLEKALYEVLYEIQSRPHMARLPIRAVLELIQEND